MLKNNFYVKQQQGFILLDTLIALSIVSLGILIILSTYAKSLSKRQDYYQEMELNRILYEESAELIQEEKVRSSFFSPIYVNKSDKYIAVSSENNKEMIEVLSYELNYTDHLAELKEIEKDEPGNKKSDESEDHDESETNEEISEQ